MSAVEASARTTPRPCALARDLPRPLARVARARLRRDVPPQVGVLPRLLRGGLRARATSTSPRCGSSGRAPQPRPRDGCRRRRRSCGSAATCGCATTRRCSQPSTPRATCCPSSSSTPGCSRPTPPHSAAARVGRVAVEGHPRARSSSGAATPSTSSPSWRGGRRRSGARLARDHAVRRAAATRPSAGPRRGRASSGSPPARRTPWGRVASSTSRAAPYRVFTPFSHAPGASTAGPPRRPRPQGASAVAARRPVGAATPCPRRARGPRLPRPARTPRCGGGGLPRRAARRLRRRTATAPTSTRTSRLSPYLKVGAIHPRTILADLAAHAGRAVAGREHLRRPSWPGASSTPTCCGTTPTRRGTTCDPSCARMTYDEPDRRCVDAWQRGPHRLSRSSTPGCASSLDEGWMHNRVRMITASFLTKDLHVWWPVGARHFLDHLVDGDIASQQPRLAVGRRHRHRRVAVLPGLQPGDPGEEVRPRRRLRAPLGARAARTCRAPRRTSRGSTTTGYDARLPEPVVDHDEERAEALRRYERARR